MKKIIVLVLLLTLTLSLVLTGCTTVDDVTAKTEEAAEEAPEKVEAVEEKAPVENAYVGNPEDTYYMISFLSGHPFWIGCRKGMEAAAEQLGVQTMYGGDPEYDVNKAVAAFEQIAATKPKGILLTCISPEPFVEVINNAVDAGVPVITFDTDSPNSKRLSDLIIVLQKYHRNLY